MLTRGIVTPPKPMKATGAAEIHFRRRGVEMVDDLHLNRQARRAEACFQIFDGADHGIHSQPSCK